MTKPSNTAAHSPLITVESITECALDAFWQAIVQQLPHATTGDLCPLTTVRFDMAAQEAVFQWIANNATTFENDVVKGYRFRLFREVRSPDFHAPEGLTGVVTTVDEKGVWAQMDRRPCGRSCRSTGAAASAPPCRSHTSAPRWCSGLPGGGRSSGRRPGCCHARRRRRLWR